MSLLDCVCCPEHNYRTAVISDDLKISSSETYGNIIERACRLACFMRQKLKDLSGQYGDDLQQDVVVAFWSECCPEAVSGILGILSVPAVYMPMATEHQMPPSGADRRGNRMEQRLQQYGVRIAMVHHSCIHEFTCEDWSGIHVNIDKTLMDVGFICANFDYLVSVSLRPLPPTSSLPLPVPPSTPTHLCTSTKKCQTCHTFSLKTKNFHKELAHLSANLIRTYYTDIQGATHCCVCNGRGNQSNSDSTIYSSTVTCHPIVAINSNICSSDKWNFPTLSPVALAYIMHTSGTTGRPKPVRVPHCCIVPNIVDLTRRFLICPDDCIFNAAPLTFDPSVVEIFLALCNGAALLTVSRQVKRSPRDLATVLFDRNHSTVLQITPSLFYRFPEEEMKSRLLGGRSRVRILAFGGEKFPPLQLLAKYKTTTNVTQIFNVYGTTEVSSWSTCHAVSETDLQRSLVEGAEERSRERQRGAEGEPEKEEERVPLGEPLLGTLVEVKEESAGSEKGEFGEIYLGGGYRVCLLGDEISPAPSTLRGTGDWGWVSEDGVMYFAGRMDRQIKRWGHRVSLDQIEEVTLECIQSHHSVSVCAVTALSSGPLHRDSSHPQTRLAAFTVAVSHHSTAPSLWVDQLMSDLVHSLPGHYVPDVIIPVHYLPCNQHGKVDVNRLLRFDTDPSLYLTPLPAALPLNTPPLMDSAVMPAVQPPASEEVRTGTNLPQDVNALQDNLLSVVTRFTRFSNWPPDLTLLELGASSFDVVRIADTVGLQFQQYCRLPQLTHVLLSKSLREVVNYTWTEISGVERMGGEICVCGEEGMREEVGVGGEEGSDEICVCGEVGMGGEVGVSGGKNRIGFSQLCKRKRKEGEVPAAKRVVPSCEPLHVFRRGQAFVNGELSLNVLCIQPERTDTKSHKVSLSVKWSFNTGRCVDASPLVVRQGLAPPTVFIGSHSGVFVSLSVHSGTKYWQTQLSNRIESSACVSLCGSYVIVGCYDGSVYCLQSGSGVICWTLQLSREPVKSSACVDVANGWIWIGSHDHYLYSIDIEIGRVVHKVFLGGGACFSSPCIDLHRGLVYAATLQGTVAAVDKDEGCIVWSYSCGEKPVFSSPSLLPGGQVVVGCVDGSVYVIDPDGKEAMQLRTEQPIFSSCSIALLYFSQHCDRDTVTEVVSGTAKDSVLEKELKEVSGVVEKVARVNEVCEYSVRVLCGSHDKCVYCWDGEGGRQIWRTGLDSEVYATPVACNLLKDTATTSSSALPCVCACTTSGQVHLLDIPSGGVLGSVRLPGEVFSSPVVVDNHLLVGCRDDCVYCIECKFDSHF